MTILLKLGFISKPLSIFKDLLRSKFESRWPLLTSSSTTISDVLFIDALLSSEVLTLVEKV